MVYFEVEKMWLEVKNHSQDGVIGLVIEGFSETGLLF